MNKIIIGICTYKRPAMFKTALIGVNQLHHPKGKEVEILIIDNDANGSAKQIVKDFAKTSRYPVHYHIEPNPGLVNARNRLLQEAYKLKGDWLAGFDDDDYPEEEWLVELVNAAEKYKADAVHGPRFLYIDENSIWLTQVSSKRTDGQEIRMFATNNYFVNLNYLKKRDMWFDMQFNFVGAEDSDLSLRMHKSGAKIVWTNKAILNEIERDDRTTFKVLIKRTVARTYSGILLHKKHDPSVMHRMYHTMLRLIRRIIVFPFSIFLGKKKFMHQLVKVTSSIAELYYLMGNKSQLYKKTDGK